MNIFFLAREPDKIPKWMVDSHVSKMVLETCQLLSTAHHFVKSPQAREVYKPTHINHPSCVWTRASKSNYQWLYRHMIAIDKEFKFRYGKNHMSCLSLWESLSVIPDLPDIGLTVPPRAMDPEYKVGDGKTWDSVCESYRNYYVRGKRRLHSWKFREEPEWFGTYSI